MVSILVPIRALTHYFCLRADVFHRPCACRGSNCLASAIRFVFDFMVMSGLRVSYFSGTQMLNMMAKRSYLLATANVAAASFSMDIENQQQ